MRDTATITVEGVPLAVRVAAVGSTPFLFFPSMGEYPAYDDAVYDGFALKRGVP